jgi:hypothetical protein
MKLLKVLVAALVMVAMAVPVIAEDRLSLNGEMRVRGWHLDADFDGDTDDSTTTFGDQRLRIGGKIAVAEGVSITFRTDITESTWGTTGGGNGFGSGRSGATQQWDRAHMDLTFSNGFHLRAGQQFVGTFGTNALDSQDNGLSFDFNPGVKVTGLFLVDNNNSTASNSGGDASDTILTGLIVAPAGDNFKSKIFVANQSKGAYAASSFEDLVDFVEDVGIDTGIAGFDSASESVYLIGASASTTFGPVKFFGEVDFFTGDSFTLEFDDGSTSELDAMGSQVFLDASIAASDAFTVGAQFFYAAGDDEDIQYTGLGNRFNGWDPVNDVGTQLSNEQIDLTDQGLNNSPFDWTGANAGSVSGRLYGNFKASDDLSFGASAAYLTVEEDAIVDADAYVLAAGMVYSLLENTTFQLQLQYTDGSIDEVAGVDIDGDFDVFSAGTGLFVKF